MTTKIKFLIVINIALLAGVLISLQSSQSNSTIALGQQSFTLEDTLGIKKIVLGKNTLEKTGTQTWEVNGKYTVQPSRIQSLLAVLGRLQVKRPVPEASISRVDSLITNNPFKVSIFNDAGNPQKAYYLAGNGDETYAKLDSQNESYILYIPGYFVNIYELFAIDEQAWRDKRVLYTTWRSLQKLTIDYTEGSVNDLDIRFGSAFYNVDKVEQLDSAKLYTYIQQFQNFEVDAFVQDGGKIKKSLSETTPFCVMVLNDLYESRNNSLSIYPNDSTVYGISNKGGEVVQMNRNMLRNFLVSRQEFEKLTN